jgi:hypothetical protein
VHQDGERGQPEGVAAQKVEMTEQLPGADAAKLTAAVARLAIPAPAATSDMG